MSGQEAAARRTPQRPRRPWRPLDGYWRGGYAAAMLAVIEVANETAERSDRAARCSADGSASLRVDQGECLRPRPERVGVLEHNGRRLARRRGG